MRDYGFATSRQLHLGYDGGKNWRKGCDGCFNVSHQREIHLWEDWSTKAVASTLESYSRMTFDYPYHKAISVHADQDRGWSTQ